MEYPTKHNYNNGVVVHAACPHATSCCRQATGGNTWGLAISRTSTPITTCRLRTWRSVVGAALLVTVLAIVEAQLATVSAASAGPIVYFRNPLTGALAKSGTDRMPTDVPQGSNDAPLVSIALDAAEQRMFYSNGAVVTRANLDGSDAAVVIPAVYMYVIGGVNFGASRTELVSIEIHGVACTSVHYWSSTSIGCVTANPAHNDVAVTVYDVSILSTVGGRGSGVDDNEAAVKRAAAGFNTPMVSSVRKVARSPAPRALAYDDATSTLLWSDTESGTIHRSDPSGQYIQLVASGLFEVYGMATANDMLWYTDHNEGRVVRVNLTAAGDLYDDPELAGVVTTRVVSVAPGGIVPGTGMGASSESDRAKASKTLLRGFTGLRGIALDVGNGHMYLTEASGTIYRARIDGRNMQRNPRKRKVYARAIVRRPSSARLDGIAVTQGGEGVNPRRIFWTESNTNAVFSANTYGAEITQLVGQTADMVWPRAIALLHEEGSNYVDHHLFWTQYVGRIHRASTTGANREAVVDNVRASSGFAAVEAEVKAAMCVGTPTLFNVE